MDTLHVAQKIDTVQNVFVYYLNESARKIPAFQAVCKKFQFDKIDVTAETELQTLLDFFTELYTLDSESLQDVGYDFALENDYPDEVTSFSTGLQSIESFYEMSSGSGNAESLGSGFMYGTVSRSVHRVLLRSPFPCEFEKGLIRGIAKLHGKKVKVEHHDFHCRTNKEFDSCDYFVIELG